MTTITTSPFFNATLAIVASAAMLTFAVAPAEASSVPVTVFPHELATPEGRAVVDARLERAAERACGATLARETLAAQAASKACVAEALADARIQVAAVKTRSQMASN